MKNNEIKAVMWWNRLVKDCEKSDTIWVLTVLANKYSNSISYKKITVEEIQKAFLNEVVTENIDNILKTTKIFKAAYPEDFKSINQILSQLGIDYSKTAKEENSVDLNKLLLDFGLQVYRNYTKNISMETFVKNWLKNEVL